MYLSRYNTDTLAYKLLSGRLRNNRKHSEQLNKYVAGLIDTDGNISLFFYKTRTTNKQKVSVSLNLTQSAVNDPDFEALRAIQSFYNLGSFNVSIPTEESHHSIGQWTLRDRESKILFNRLGKHLRTKGRHFENLIWISNEHKDVDDIPECVVEELKDFSKCSRRETSWLKMPKHLSWAYVAGVIAGNGSIKLKTIRDGHNYPEMVVTVANQKCDIGTLELLKRDFRGNIYCHKTADYCTWERNLGISDSSFAVDFLSKLVRYIIHERKYLTMLNILQVHEEHRQQRLNRGNPKG